VLDKVLDLELTTGDCTTEMERLLVERETTEPMLVVDDDSSDADNGALEIDDAGDVECVVDADKTGEATEVDEIDSDGVSAKLEEAVDKVGGSDDGDSNEVEDADGVGGVKVSVELLPKSDERDDDGLADEPADEVRDGRGAVEGFTPAKHCAS